VGTSGWLSASTVYSCLADHLHSRILYSIYQVLTDHASFLPTTKYIEPAQITAAIYRSTVEVFAAIGANRKPRVSKGYEVGALLSPATSASIQYTAENGAVSVTYPSAEVETAVLRAGSAQVDEVEAEAILDDEIVDDVNTTREISKKELAELRATIDSWGRSWREIPLEDQKIKFAVSLP